MSARQGGNKYEHNSTNPYHKVPPVDNPEASNDFPDSPAEGMLGNEGSNVVGATVGPGRDGNTDRMGQEVEVMDGNGCKASVIGNGEL